MKQYLSGFNLMKIANLIIMKTKTAHRLSKMERIRFNYSQYSYE